MTRLITGLLLAAGVVSAVKVGPAWVIWVCAAVVGLLATEELRRILGKLAAKPWPVLSHVATLGTIAAFLLPSRPLAAVLAATMIFAFVRALVPTQQPEQGIGRVIGTLVPVLYIGVPLAHLVGLFPADADPVARERAEDLVMLVLCAVYLSDTLALYGGKTFGRHLMAPGISPKKTWEGAASGMVGAFLGGAAAHYGFFRTMPLEHALLLAAILALAGMAGDLGESLLKRAAAVKDSGSLLPGHGGLLDRVDSLLFAIPIVYWYDRWWFPH